MRNAVDWPWVFEVRVSFGSVAAARVDGRLAPAKVERTDLRTARLCIVGSFEAATVPLIAARREWVNYVGGKVL
jgi:hypothetical protein